METPASSAVYARRRAQVVEAMRAAGGGIALLPTAPELMRNADSEHAYRHASHFFHLTGFVEPQSWLVLTASGRSILFCRERDEAREVWDGVRLGPQAAPAVLGVDEAHPLPAMDELMPTLVRTEPSLWYPYSGHDGIRPRLDAWLESAPSHAPDLNGGGPEHRDLLPLLDDLRLIKDSLEVALMRRAAEITAGAHVRAMRFCAERLRGGATGLYEYEIEAELLHEFRRLGASGPSYTPIVAAGANACVLHHVAGSDGLGLSRAPTLLKRGELCLIDAGAEYGSYAADVTRTFPADGRFSAAQRAVYDVVYEALQAAAAATVPGARKTDGHWAAVRVLAQGMLDLGLLDRQREGSVDDVIHSASYRRFYMHGTGHWLGLDVHDVGDVLARDEAPVEQPDPQGGTRVKQPSRKLVPGMVLTIEPGLYVRPAPDVPREFWNIGVRIEDDAIVTPQGCELITRGVPVHAGEIERLMAG